MLEELGLGLILKQGLEHMIGLIIELGLELMLVLILELILL